MIKYKQPTEVFILNIVQAVDVIIFAAGRIYATYGGVYICVAIIWL